MTEVFKGILEGLREVYEEEGNTQVVKRIDYYLKYEKLLPESIEISKDVKNPRS